MSQELLKKTKKKRTRTIVIVAVLAAMVILGFIGFTVSGGSDNGGQAPEGTAAGTAGAAGTVTLEIDCSDLSKQMDRLTDPSIKDYIPADGVILPPTEYAFKEGETVFDCLDQVCREQNIQMESSEDSVYKSRYVEGIGHLYEKDAGKRSGWTYYVNGDMPDYGCSKFKLTDGAQIRWVYVVDYTEKD